MKYEISKKYFDYVLLELIEFKRVCMLSGIIDYQTIKHIDELFNELRWYRQFAKWQIIFVSLSPTFFLKGVREQDFWHDISSLKKILHMECCDIIVCWLFSTSIEGWGDQATNIATGSAPYGKILFKSENFDGNAWLVIIALRLLC